MKLQVPFSTYGEVVYVDGPQDGPSGRQAHVRMRDVDGASAIMGELSRNGGCLSFDMPEKWMWRRPSASRKVAVAVVRLSGDDEETYFRKMALSSAERRASKGDDKGKKGKGKDTSAPQSGVDDPSQKASAVTAGAIGAIPNSGGLSSEHNFRPDVDALCWVPQNGQRTSAD
jgi:hypothetical protein